MSDQIQTLVPPSAPVRFHPSHVSPGTELQLYPRIQRDGHEVRAISESLMAAFFSCLRFTVHFGLSSVDVRPPKGTFEPLPGPWLGQSLRVASLDSTSRFTNVHGLLFISGGFPTEP